VLPKLYMTEVSITVLINVKVAHMHLWM